MPGPADLVRELHRLRRFANDLKEEIDRFPRQTILQQKRVSKAEEALREHQDGTKKLKVSIHEKEVSLKSTTTLIRKHEEQLGGVGSKKEYDALVTEIKNECAAIQKLEEEILLAMTEVDERVPKLPEFEQAVARAKEEYSRWEKEAKARHAEQTAQLAETQAKLKATEASIPEKVRPLYNRAISAMGHDAMAAVRNRTCSSCQTGITAQNMNELTQGQMLLCKACGRLLYLPEEAPPLV